jgi:AcrR family transcriptional regulator
MSEPVKRRYDASARRERAAATRRVVVDAARHLLLTEGYPATTVPAVAAAAGVSAEFVYKNVGGRAALLAAVLDVALAGDDADVRLAGMTGLARHLLALGVPGDVERVRDVLWTCTAAELYDLLVTRRGWTAAAYGDFVLGTLRAALLAR